MNPAFDDMYVSCMLIKKYGLEHVKRATSNSSIEKCASLRGDDKSHTK